MSAPQLVLISGLSGSGKSIALNVLEDSGYYCVDNLPAKLLPEIAAYLRDAGYDRIAVSVDARGGEPVQELPARLLELREQGMDVRVLFLEANTETLVKRFSETRRRHPLSKDRLTVEEAIALERHLLDPLSQIAQRVDSSELGPTEVFRAVRRDARHDDRELFAAIARHGVDFAHAAFQAACDKAQHLVAGAVAPRVVEHLEMVDVADDETHRRPLGARPRDFLRQRLVESLAVGNAGQPVGAGFIARLGQIGLERVEFALGFVEAFLEAPCCGSPSAPRRS